MKVRMRCARFYQLSLATLVLFMVHSGLRAQQQVTNPIPESIEFSDLTLFLNNFTQIPTGTRNHADNRPRINLLKELPDGTGRYAVNDLNGYLYLIDSATGEVSLYLDLWEHLEEFIDAPGKGTGFGGFAFHPEFKENGIFYTAQSEAAGSGDADFIPIEDNGIALQWTLIRWIASTPSSNKFEGAYEEMARFDYPSIIHGLQDISFNPLADESHPDYGMLYVCVGDGGSSSGRGLTKNSQDLSSFLGTIWRIDPEGKNSVTGQYGIPEDNPFVQEDNALGEIWAYGFRNPHRLCFDHRKDGEALLACDIGEHNIEELNLIIKGGNYGWNKREGLFLYKDATRAIYPAPEEDEDEFLYPVAQYDHDEGYAIVSGYVWRADSNPAFLGEMFVADIVNGRIFHAPVDSLQLGRQYPLQEIKIVDVDSIAKSFQEISGNRVDIRFGYNSRKEMFVLTKADGKIYKIADSGKIKEEEEPDPEPEPPVTAVSAPDEQNLWFSPTAFTSFVYFQEDHAVSVFIYDIHGKIVYRKTALTDKQLDLSALPAGVYIAVATSSNSIFRQKLVKIH